MAGTYYDTLSTGWHDSLVVTKLSVKPLPTLTVTTSADTICSGGSALLSGAGTSGSYQWSVNAGSATTATVSVSPTLTSTYTLVGMLNGCSMTRTIGVVVKNCIGIQNIKQQGFAAYPNPASDKFYIQSLKSGSLRIISVTGQIVLEQDVRTGENEINTGNLPAGVYELSLRAGDRVLNSKLMISK